jgi:hypothetical protein
MRIESDSSDRALLVASMVGRGVLILAAMQPRLVLRLANEFARVTQGDAVFFGESFRAFSHKHHVRTVFEDRPCEPDRIADALQGGDCPGAEGRSVHDDGVAFNVAIEIQMRAESGVENGLVFENENGCFNGVQRGTAAGKNRPAGFQRPAAAGIAGFDSFVGNIPSAAMNDERRFHREENGKAREDCPEGGKAAVFIR